MAPQPIPVRVLVIDDDPMSRELLRLLLQTEGYTVECADSGEAALASLRQSGRAPGLVLADAQMPGIAGGRLAGELRRACSAQTLLLAMSGSRPPQEAISRFDGFLLKPFTMEQIASALAARGTPDGTVKSPARQKRRTVAAGPARQSPSNTRSISIHASALEPGGTPTAAASGRGAGRQPPRVHSAQGLSGDRPGDVAVLDEAVYDRLATLMTAPQLHEIYCLCATDVRKRIAAMRRMAAERDSAGLAREAHAIKGSCGMLGATELGRMAAEMEANGLQAAAADGSRQVNSLDELAAACDRLERILGSRA